MAKSGLLKIVVVLLLLNVLAYSQVATAAGEDSLAQITIVVDPVPPVKIPAGEPVRIPDTMGNLSGNITRPVPATGLLPKLGTIMADYGQYGILIELVTLILLLLLLRRERKEDA